MINHYRADHVGSLLRPPELVRARSAYAEGRLGLDELRRVEDRAILDVLTLQRQIGLDVFTADPKFLDRMRLDGIDPAQSLAEAIAADNACLEAANGQEITPGIHLCRGNSRSRWLAEGSYEPIAEKLFGSLEADRFLLEYDSERAGSFAPLRFVPKGKSVVLGLVTTKTGQLELQEELLRRIEEASAFVSLENLAISPQCGFASSVPGNLISYDEQRRKLELVADTARKVWRENR
jgi:5-methyltetrahydropteroyltriglutamate--homocysteine methyltransferase